jgi:GTP cyclohydrolase II
MFTYLDPTVRQKLVDQGKLVRIDQHGNRLPDRHIAQPGDLIINMLGPVPLPIRLGDFEGQVQWYAAVRSTELTKVEELAQELRSHGGQNLFSALASSIAVNSVLVVGTPAENPLVRVHSNCLTGDVFGSQRCECGPQLKTALERIAADPSGGYLVYMAGHEGRGIGLWAKAATYLLQDSGENTYEANRSLGLPDDSRDFTDAASLLSFFIGNMPFRLLTNNPKKIEDLARLGLNQIEPVGHVAGVTDWNRRYLEAKRNWGHRLDETAIKD